MPYDEVNSNGQRQLMRTEKFADYHEQFGNLLFGEAIANVLKQLSGDVSTTLSPSVGVSWDGNVDCGRTCFSSRTK
jgi:hypothetical protein